MKTYICKFVIRTQQKVYCVYFIRRLKDNVLHADFFLTFLLRGNRMSLNNKGKFVGFPGKMKGECEYKKG